MADHDSINLTTGETAIQTADRMAGKGGNPPHPSADYSKPKQFVGPKIQPNAPGGKVYGTPIQAPIVK